jgi:hypothetical protein
LALPSCQTWGETGRMTTTRTLDQRRSDTLTRLAANGQAWLATAGIGSDGTALPHVIAVSPTWTGTVLLIATRSGTPTARNLDATGRARLVLGSPDDVVMVDVQAAPAVPATGADPSTLAARATFTAAQGWDPADEGPDWRYHRLTPTTIQAYRGYDELGDHVLMRDGAWRA